MPNLILAQRKEDALPIWRPRRIIAVVTRDILENRGLAAGDFRDGNVADISRVVVFSTVLNATCVPSGEIAGKIPSAIFLAPVASRFAIQTALLRSKAM